MSTKVQTSADIPDGVAVPELMETRIGLLKFKDGAPSDETVKKVYDNLDFIHAFEAYVNGYQLASLKAMHKGLLSVGAEDNGGVVIWSGLMDGQSLFLTANADTIYYIFTLNLNDGPIVVETPPDALGLFDDFWFQHVIDFGRPGPDRGQGGKFLLVPPGYDGPLPDSGFHVGTCTSNFVMAFGRNFLVNNDPKPTVKMIKDNLKIYPYTPGMYGTSIATLLEGKVHPGKPTPIKPTHFIEGTGLVMNTLPPSDHTYFDMLNEIVQEEPSGVISKEIMGSFAAIGIVKGKEFKPDNACRRF